MIEVITTYIPTWMSDIIGAVHSQLGCVGANNRSFLGEDIMGTLTPTHNFLKNEEK